MFGPIFDPIIQFGFVIGTAFGRISIVGPTFDPISIIGLNPPAPPGPPGCEDQ